MTNIINLDEERRKRRNLPIPKIPPVLDDDFDDVPVFDRGLLWGIREDRPKNPLTLFFVTQSDPGDETDR